MKYSAETIKLAKAMTRHSLKFWAKKGRPYLTLQDWDSLGPDNQELMLSTVHKFITGRKAKP